jgi:CheY-like chemotaxis protein
MHQSHTHGAADGPSRPHGLARAGLAVLVVEDHEGTAASIEQILRVGGHRVRVAHDGARALTALAESVPDVVILDVRLPDMSAQDLARRVAVAAGPGRAPPLVIALADQRGHEGRADEAGIDLHLLKPVDPDRLLAVLGRFRDGMTAPGAPPEQANPPGAAPA